MLFYLFIFIVTFFLTALLRVYALKRNVIDLPNVRSSHQIPTPRGGGVAFVIIFLIFAPLMVVIKLAASLIVLIGFIDDHQPVSAKIRFMLHCIAGVLTLYAIDKPIDLTVFGYSFSLGYLGYTLVILGLVWFVNLYNFMDGIDGLAALESISVIAAVFILHSLTNAATESYQWQLYLIAAVTGFLVWNWPPAKIFMGDGGSGFLGFMMAYGLLFDTKLNPVWLWIWLILMGVFIIDATLTLFRRILLRQNIAQPHRTHAYQNASRLLQSHKVVTLTIFVINVFWLFPIAFAVFSKKIDGSLGLIIAYTPLLILAFKMKAGQPELKQYDYIKNK